MKQLLTLLALAGILSLPAIASADVLDEIGGGQRAGASRVRDHKRFVASGDVLSIDYREQINFAPLLDRLYTLLTSPDWLGGKWPECDKAVKAAAAMGAFSLTSTLEELKVDGEDITAHFSTYYANLDPATERAMLLGIKDAPLQSAGLTSSDAIFYFGMNNLDAYLKACAQCLQQAPEGGPLSEMLGEFGMADAESALAMASMLGLDEMAKETLTGEIGLALYGLPPVEKLDSGSMQPGDIPFAVMIGLKGSGKVDELLAGFGGQAGLTAVSDAVPGWKVFAIAESGGVMLAYNDSMALLASTPDVLAKSLNASTAGALDAPACQYHIEVNFPALANACAPYADKLMAELASEVPDGGTFFLPEKEMAYLVDLPEDMAAMGSFTATGHHDQGYSVNVAMKTAAFRYLAYYLGTLGCAAAQTGAFD